MKKKQSISNCFRVVYRVAYLRKMRFVSSKTEVQKGKTKTLASVCLQGFNLQYPILLVL